MYILTDEMSKKAAIIIGKEVYTLASCTGEEIAELFNGGDALPLVQSLNDSNLQ